MAEHDDHGIEGARRNVSISAGVAHGLPDNDVSTSACAQGSLSAKEWYLVEFDCPG
jgi:hypothetical protein